MSDDPERPARTRRDGAADEEESGSADRRGFAPLARAFGLASFIGVPFALLVSFGALAGSALDKRFGTAPWLLLIGLLFGAVSAFVNMLRVLRQFQGLDDHSEERSRPASGSAPRRGPRPDGQDAKALDDAEPPDQPTQEDDTP